jgi:hypothetical protein
MTRRASFGLVHYSKRARLTLSDLLARSKQTDGACRPTSEPRQAPPRYRAPISTRVPTMLFMDGPGRLVRAQRDLDRAGSGGKRAPDPEAVVVVPVVGGVPVAVGRAEVLWIVVP